ncbi:MAG: hypothetical protein WBQ86_00815 [Candidatus Binatus sp.]
MAGYALIMAAVAVVVVFAGYQTMGTTITKLLGNLYAALETDV